MNKKPLLAACLIVLTAAAFAAEPEFSEKKPQEELQKVVVLARHGVRSPIQNAEQLKEISPKPWPDWGVPPAYLTPRGFHLVKQTWEQNKIHSPAFSNEGCPKKGEVQVVADNDQRCTKSAEALIEGLYPGCGITVEHTDKKYSSLFSPLRAGVCEIKEPDELAKKLTAKTADVSRMYYEEIKMLGDVADNDFFSELKGVVTKTSAQLKGKLYKAAQFTEILNLEWAEWPDKIPGWEMMPWWRIEKAFLLRVKLFSIVERDVEYARYRGSAMAKRIMDTLSATDGPKYTFIVGHDTNIANISALFDLTWKMVDRAEDECALGGYITFEKWLIDGRPMLRIFYSALRPIQVHMENVTEPPETVSLTRREVDFEAWKMIFKNRLASACIPKDLNY
ncbi:MAG: histidine acid phosphatase [Burkholderiales bacterium]|nr:histidine acid phosphatase [Burkholderiales bacterium]